MTYKGQECYTPLYSRWVKLRNRDKGKRRQYTVCVQWRHSYFNFKKWAEDNGIKPGDTILRFDNNKIFSPDNCYLAPRDSLPLSNNNTGYRGVHRIKSGKFHAHIWFEGKSKSIGLYDSIQDAVLAKNNFIVENNLPHKIIPFLENTNE